MFVFGTPQDALSLVPVGNSHRLSSRNCDFCVAQFRNLAPKHPLCMYIYPRSIQPLDHPICACDHLFDIFHFSVYNNLWTTCPNPPPLSFTTPFFTPSIPFSMSFCMPGQLFHRIGACHESFLWFLFFFSRPPLSPPPTTISYFVVHSFLLPRFHSLFPIHFVIYHLVFFITIPITHSAVYHLSYINHLSRCLHLSLLSSLLYSTAYHFLPQFFLHTILHPSGSRVYTYTVPYIHIIHARRYNLKVPSLTGPEYI